MQRLDRYWYSINPISLALWPLGLLFWAVASMRRLAYRLGVLKSYCVGAPVIIVGNLTVGGSGKTPLVIRIVEALRKAGFRPGIISRGYGGNARDWPRQVNPDSDPVEVGDEPVLLAQRCGCPVVVAPDRVAAAQTLLKAHPDCTAIVSDNGLQHYRLARDIEIAVIDANRRLGNGACLPAGPLREPARRLRNVDFVVANGKAESGQYLMKLTGEQAVNLVDPSITCTLAGFRRDLVHAVAGIGDPARFFGYLRERGIRLLEHPFPDHHRFIIEYLEFHDELPVLMTEKDAVKCHAIVREWFWYVPVEAQIEPSLEQQLIARLKGSTKKILA